MKNIGINLADSATESLREDHPTHQKSFQNTNLSALQSFGLAPSNQENRKGSSKLINMMAAKKQRRASHIYKGMSNRGVPTMPNSDIYGQGKGGNDIWGLHNF